MNKAIKKAESNQQVSSSQKELTTSEQNTEIAVHSFDGNQAGELANQLSACVLVSKTYGKQGAGDIEPIVDIFIDDLKEFEPDKVINAVIEHRKNHDDFPTPASIRRILSPEPVMNSFVYNELIRKMKNGTYLTQQEHKYLSRFEEAQMKGL